MGKGPHSFFPNYKKDFVYKLIFELDMSKSVSYGIVTFIDFLGFSNQVETAKSLAGIKEIIKQVQSLRDEFKEDHELLKLAKKEVIAFTDCVIISVAGESKLSYLQGTYDTWLSELSLLAYSQFSSVLETNIFIRGGMSDGWWYHEDNVIVSPAQVEAYRLEKDEAKYPIIVLSDHLAEYFTDPDNYKSYSDNPTEVLLLKDEDKERNGWFINYLGYGVEELGWMGNKDIEEKHRRCHDDDKKRHLRTEGWKLNAKKVFERHKEVILNAYRSLLKEDVRQKYVWLAKYHNDIVERYGNHFEETKIDNIDG